MKARVKATGKIVCIERNLDYPGGYVASDGKIYNACDLELIVDNDPDYWTRLEHQYAGMAMQGILSGKSIMERIAKFKVKDLPSLVADLSIQCAHALVGKMKEADR